MSVTNSGHGTRMPDFKRDGTAALRRRRFSAPFKNRFPRKLTLAEAEHQLSDFHAALDDCADEHRHEASWRCFDCHPDTNPICFQAHTSSPVAPSKQTTDNSLAWSEC